MFESETNRSQTWNGIPPESMKMEPGSSGPPGREAIRAI